MRCASNRPGTEGPAVGHFQLRTSKKWFGVGVSLRHEKISPLSSRLSCQKSLLSTESVKRGDYTCLSSGEC